MTRIIGLSGSLRRQSFNTGLLRAAAELAPEGVTIAVHTPEGIPLYNGDAETAEGIPPVAAALKDAIAAADGLLLVTPEYNNGIPGVFKNTIDWLSRPPADTARIFAGKPVALIGASPGGFGTILSQEAWLGVLRTLGTRPWFGGRLMVARAGSLYSPEGDLTDEKTRERLREFVAGFAAFVAGAKA